MWAFRWTAMIFKSFFLNSMWGCRWTAAIYEEMCLTLMWVLHWAAAYIEGFFPQFGVGLSVDCSLSLISFPVIQCRPLAKRWRFLWFSLIRCGHFLVLQQVALMFLQYDVINVRLSSDWAKLQVFFFFGSMWALQWSAADLLSRFSLIRCRLFSGLQRFRLILPSFDAANCSIFARHCSGLQRTAAIK